MKWFKVENMTADSRWRQKYPSRIVEISLNSILRTSQDGGLHFITTLLIWDSKKGFNEQIKIF